MNAARLTVLARFIRSQANLTDKHPHAPGPGEVKLNHAEALEVVEALEAQAAMLETVEMLCRTAGVAP